MTGTSSSRAQLLAAAVLFSTGGAAIKMVQAFDGWEIAGLRSGIAAVALLLLVPAARRGWSWRVLPVAAAYAATLVLFVLANRLTTSAATIFLQSSAPLYLLFLGPLLLKEPLRRGDLPFVAAVVAGLALVFAGSGAPLATAPDPLRGNFLAAASGVTWALTVIGLRWMGRGTPEDGSPLATVVAGNALAFLATLPMAYPVAGAPGLDWLLVGYLGVFQIGLAYLLVSHAIRGVSALEAATLLLLEPALNPLWSWGAHGERPTLWVIVGGGLIAATTIGRSRRGSRGTGPPV